MRRAALVFDVMDTLVHDPHREAIATVMGVDIASFHALTDKSAYLRFERGEIDEQEYAASWLRSGERAPVEAIRDHLRDAYRWIDGMEALLDELSQQPAVSLHTLSNYGPWYEHVEAATRISRWASWRFVSCKTGHRKPDRAAYDHVAQALGSRPSQITLIDDRAVNCEGARRAGWDAILFSDVSALREALTARGVVLTT